MSHPGISTRLNVLNNQECFSIIETCKPFVEPSEIGTPDSSHIVDTKTRSSKSVMISPRDPRFDSIQPLMQKTVEAFMICTQTFFHYPVTHVEDIQFTEYLEGDFYNWHMDASPTTPRFSSASLCLSNFAEFQGGQLSFRDMIDPETEGDEPLSIRIQQGELAVFPSLLVHSVKPITQGKRYALVLWTPYVDEEILQKAQEKSEAPVMTQGHDPIVF
tara:strand:+ start:601 stop:1251 length:651 start_codon:yes stop_codon:yes gene_type:complete